MSPGLPSSGPFVTQEQNPYVVQTTVWSGFLLLMSERHPQQEQAACSRRGGYNNSFVIRLFGKEEFSDRWACSIHITLWENTALCRLSAEL